MADNLSTVIMKTLSESCPDMDWASGSVARELIAVPAALLGTVFDKYVQDAYRMFDINALRSDPENNKEAIDEWFSLLNMEDKREQTAYGKIKIYLSDINSTLVIMKGTMFSIGTVKVSAVDTTTWLGVNSTSVDGAYATLYPDGTYSIEIDVAATSRVSIAIKTGTSVSWTSAPSSVQGVYVSSAIAGGTTKLTYAEKAEKIFDALQKPSLTTADNMQALLRNTFPNVINSVKVGRRNSSDINTVNVYVKPVRAPETFNLTSTARNGMCSIRGCGVYAVTGVIYDNKPVYDYTVSFDGVIGSSDSIIHISFPKKIEGSVTVTCEGFSSFVDIDNILNSVNALSACSFRILMPTVAYIGVDIQTDAELTDDNKQAIYDYINTCTLNSTVMSDTQLNVILTNQGIVTKGPTFYTANIVHGITKHVTTAAGSLNIAQLSFDSDVPTACYSFIDNIGTI